MEFSDPKDTKKAVDELKKLRDELAQERLNVGIKNEEIKTMKDELERATKAMIQLSQDLKTAAEKWERTFDSISDLVSIQDKDFRIVKVNRAYANAFKMRPEELIGKFCYEVMHKTKESPPFALINKLWKLGNQLQRNFLNLDWESICRYSFHLYLMKMVKLSVLSILLRTSPNARRQRKS